MGREPTRMLPFFKLSHISLPSGENLIPEDQRRKNILETDGASWSHKTYKHDGISVNIPIKHIVSPSKVEAYAILPQEHGLKQLTEKGVLKKIDKNTYLIQKAVTTFPGGLSEIHNLSFILGKGLEMPKNAPKRARFYSEETGEPLKP